MPHDPAVTPLFKTDRILGVADVHKTAARWQQSLFAFGPHHAQWLAARNRGAGKMGVNLHIVDVLLRVQIGESARGERELGRLVRGVESGDLAELPMNRLSPRQPRPMRLRPCLSAAICG